MKGGGYVEPYVGFSTYDEISHFNKDYLALKAIGGDAIVSLKNSDTTVVSITLSYSSDRQLWTPWDGTSLTIPAGVTFFFKGQNSSFRHNFVINGKVEATGDVLSLIKRDNFENDKSISQNYTFLKLFANCKGLLTTPKISSPALSSYMCCGALFSGCTSITGASDILATQYGNYSVTQMFDGCTSLKEAPYCLRPTAPALNSCYAMFRNCKSLVKPPRINATRVGQGTFKETFCGCISLVNAPELHITSFTNSSGDGVDHCYNMFSGCTSLQNVPDIPATNLGYRCFGGMFQFCTSLKRTPRLTIKKIDGYSLWSMFNGCTSLKEVNITFETEQLAERCCDIMFQDCKSLEVAPELPVLNLASMCYTKMFYGCSKLRYIKANFLTTPSKAYTDSWVNSVSPTGVFVKNKDATWDVQGINGIPNGWTVETI